MQEITLTEFENKFDELMEEVETQKKSFIIIDGNKKVALVPCETGACQNQEDAVEYLRNHDDGC